MDTICVNIVVVSKQYLKIKLFHYQCNLWATFSLVWMSSSIPWNLNSRRPRLFFTISSSYLSGLISSLIFLPFLLHRYNSMLSCQRLMICQHHHKEKQFALKIPYCVFLFASLFKYSNIVFFLFGAGCFASSPFYFSSNCPSGTYWLSCTSGSLSLSSPDKLLYYYIFLWFLPIILSFFFNIVLLLLSLILLVPFHNILNVLFQFFVFLDNRIATSFGALKYCFISDNCLSFLSIAFLYSSKLFSTSSKTNLFLLHFLSRFSWS